MVTATYVRSLGSFWKLEGGWILSLFITQFSPSLQLTLACSYNRLPWSFNLSLILESNCAADHGRKTELLSVNVVNHRRRGRVVAPNTPDTSTSVKKDFHMSFHFVISTLIKGNQLLSKTWEDDPRHLRQENNFRQAQSSWNAAVELRIFLTKAQKVTVPIKHGFFIENQQQIIVNLPNWSTEALWRRMTAIWEKWGEKFTWQRAASSDLSVRLRTGLNRKYRGHHPSPPSSEMASKLKKEARNEYGSATDTQLFLCDP